MRARSLLVALTLGSWACAPEPEQTLDPSSWAERSGPADGYVAVWKDARLYQRPNLAASSVQLVELHGERRPGDVFNFRVVAEHPDWLELRPLERREREHSCYPSPRALDGLDIGLFVERREVVPVTFTALRFELHEQIVLDLPAGAHAHPLAEDRGEDVYGRPLTHVIGVGDYGIPVALEAYEVMDWYPEPVLNRRFRFDRSREFVPDLDASPRVGQVALVDQRRAPVPTAARFCGYLKITHDRTPSLPVSEPTELIVSGDMPMLRGAEREFESVRVVFPRRGGKSRTVTVHTSRRVYNPELYWPDGSRAGAATRDLAVVDVDPSSRLPGLSCFLVNDASAVVSAHERSLPLRLCTHTTLFEPRARGPVPSLSVSSGLQPHMGALVDCAVSPRRSSFEFWIDEHGRAGPRSPHHTCIGDIVGAIDWPSGHAFTEVQVRQPQQVAAAWASLSR